MHRHLALAFLLLPLHLACDDSSSTDDDIPRQETVCLEVEGPAPCCEIPTFAWVEENCPDGTKYLEGTLGASLKTGACVTADSPDDLMRSQSAGPSAQVNEANGVGVSWASGVEEDDVAYSCNSNTGRLILRREGPCPVECYDDAGNPRECGGNVNCD